MSKDTLNSIFGSSYQLPKYLDETRGEAISLALYENLLRLCPQDVERVLKAGGGDIEPSFLGFVDVYYHLSYLIELSWTVIDFGCAYAAQAYYFEQHAKYIGVDIGSLESRFTFSKTRHHVMRIEHWIDQYMDTLDLEKTFAICNYVPNSLAQKMVRENFPNCYVYYP